MRSADRPYPPLELANRVYCLDGHGDPIRAYEDLGAQTRAALLDLLPAGWSFDGRRVLDFGCGAGRTLRHFLVEAERAEIWGVDLDARSIEWLRAHLCPPLHVARCGEFPPLPLADRSVDFAWAISVFTHLTDNSIAWLLELHRVLAPDGLLMAFYMGESHSELFAGEPWDEDRIGMNVLRHRPVVGGRGTNGADLGLVDARALGPPLRRPDGRADARAELGAAAPARGAALEGGRRDAVRRPSRAPCAAPQPPAGPGELEEAHARVDATLRREYEGSLSWRLTRPLRGGGTAARALKARWSR